MNFDAEQDIEAGNARGDPLEALSESDPTFVTEEKKGSSGKSVLTLGGLALTLGGVIWFMYFRQGPQPASAAETAASGGAVRSFLESGQAHMQLMRQTLQDTDKLVQRFRAYPAQTQIPLEALHTNPFRALVPLADAENESEAASKRRREEERQAASASAARLRLQSVLQGRTCQACMIGNKLYQPGQEVDGFLVERITPEGVIVRRGVYRFELSMGQ